MQATRDIQRPALRYHGGKWRLAPWIIKHFPIHDCYVEPFGGAASVLLRKPPTYIEVYNDINHLVVNFFRVLRERPADLLAALDLTPYSREEFLLSRQPTNDPVELARRFYIWSYQGRGRAGVFEPGGWRFMSRKTRSHTPVYEWSNNQYLWSVVQRMKQVHIENDDALKVIKRFDTPATLFYVDPPYVQGERSERWRSHAYQFEYENEDHEKLAEVLHGVDGMVALSGYRCEMYDCLYADWARVDREHLIDNVNHGKGRRVTESLWLSPNLRAAQMPLFQPR